MSTNKRWSWIIGVLCLAVIGCVVYTTGNTYNWWDSEASASETTTPPAYKVTDKPKDASAPAVAVDSPEEPAVDTKPLSLLEARKEIDAYHDRLVEDAKAGKPSPEIDKLIRRHVGPKVIEIERSRELDLGDKPKSKPKTKPAPKKITFDMSAKEMEEVMRSRKKDLSSEEKTAVVLRKISDNTVHNLIMTKAVQKDVGVIKSEVGDLKKRVESLELKDIEVDERYITPAPKKESVEKPEEQLVSIAWKDSKTEILQFRHKVVASTMQPTGNTVTYIDAGGEMNAVGITQPLYYSLPYYADRRVFYNGYGGPQPIIGVSPLTVFRGPGYCLYYNNADYRDAPVVVYGETRWEEVSK